MLRNLHDTGKAVVLLKTFAPWRKKYRIKGAEGWRTEWRGWSHLETRDVEDAILGRRIIAFYMATVTRVLPIDIDDHEGKAWRGGSPSPELLTRYERVRDRLRAWPSILAQSPRGLHAFYFLDQVLPSEILQAITERRLKGIPKVEVKCSLTKPIAIPAEKRLLDPKKLLPLNADFYAVLDMADRYHPQELFDEDFLPEAIIESLKKKRTRLRSFAHTPSIEEVEGRILPFKNGQTNTAFLELCQVYRCAGLTEAETVDRIRTAALESPGYFGDLSNRKRLQARVRWEYANNQDAPTETEKKREPRPENVELAQRIAHRHPWAKQATKAVKRLIIGMLEMVDENDRIMKYSPDQVAVKDYLHGYYRHNIRSGFYPLPRDALIKLHGHYRKVVDWLIEIGFLEPAPFNYSTQTHTAKHYRIHRDRF